MLTLSHNVGWDGVVTMQMRKSNSVDYYYVSTLFIYSVVSLLGIPASFLAGWTYNRRVKMKARINHAINGTANQRRRYKTPLRGVKKRSKR